jgi:hypothetical protein
LDEPGVRETKEALPDGKAFAFRDGCGEVTHIKKQAGNLKWPSGPCEWLAQDAQPLPHDRPGSRKQITSLKEMADRER